MPSSDVVSLIIERAETHGDYSIQASISQRLKDVMRSAPNWDRLSSSQKESLEMDSVKNSRILCGNPNEVDHWDDKAGYAKLISMQIRVGMTE